MRRLVVPLLALIVLAASSAAASAIELRNEDERAYVVRVSSASMSQNIRLGPRMASLVVCTRSCSFRVAGVGQVRASGDDVVAIRKKKLVRQVVLAKP